MQSFQCPENRSESGPRNKVCAFVVIAKSAVDAAVGKNPKALEDYRKGRKSSITFLIGQVMKETRGKANAGVVRELLQKKLDELCSE